MKTLNPIDFDDAFSRGAAQGDSLQLLACVFDAIRPPDMDDTASAIAAHTALIDYLAAHPQRLQQMRAALADLICNRRLVGFFAESGILPATGFFSELLRIVSARLLPELHDPREFRDGIRQIFDHKDDWAWFEAIPYANSLRFWTLMTAESDLPELEYQRLFDQLLEAMLLLAYRISGLELDHELRRLGDAVQGYAASFQSVAGETQRYADAWREAGHSGTPCAVDERHLLVLIDQCQTLLARARRAALRVGTSLALTFLLRRADQSLHRLEMLTRVFAAYTRVGVEQEAIACWTELMRDAVRAETQRNNIAKHVSRGISFLAWRVSDNAARSGEHYITETRADYFRMWRSAMGAGVIIALLALLKLFVSKLSLAPIGYAFLYSMIYGLGFVFIYLLHLTIATKQPAMTAQTIAGYLGQANDGKLESIERVVDLVAAVTRSQIAAILGNVMIALPTAMLIGYLWQQHFGSPMLDLSKGAHLIADLDLFGWTLLHAAIAGVFLFFSGIISGYFDNLATYSRVGARVARLRWLNALCGERRAAAGGEYIEANLGGISGNFLFGCMLGSTATLGMILGLPIDIRHIAFSSANLGYAIAAFDFSMLGITIAWAALGIFLIGFVNLTVSFCLALWMALRARNIAFTQTAELLRRLWQRLRHAPLSFIAAPRDAEHAPEANPS